MCVSVKVVFFFFAFSLLYFSTLLHNYGNPVELKIWVCSRKINMQADVDFRRCGVSVHYTVCPHLSGVWMKDGGDLKQKSLPCLLPAACGISSVCVREDAEISWGLCTSQSHHSSIHFFFPISLNIKEQKLFPKFVPVSMIQVRSSLHRTHKAPTMLI